MQKQDYEVKCGKHIAFRAKDQERFAHCKSLGNNYTEEQIKKRINGKRSIIKLTFLMIALYF